MASSNLPQPKKVFLLLEDSFELAGELYAPAGKNDALGAEAVFCTAMSGIEESLSDPSFCGQLLVSTLAHVGNTGFTGEDQESDRIWAEGLICRQLCHEPSNWRAKETLLSWILRENRFVVDRVNTRALTIHLRDHGSQRALVYDPQNLSKAEALLKLKEKIKPMEGRLLLHDVSCKELYRYKSSKSNFWPTKARLKKQSSQPKLGVWDFGVKTNTLRILEACGAEVWVIPSKYTAKEILDLKLDGLLLSNGPGDPATATGVVEELKEVIGKISIFAICMGHQLLALALGAKTKKMKFGHRGIHHPVSELDEKSNVKKVWISSQNHGFEVDRETLPENCQLSFVHADDGSVEGFNLPALDLQSVQFHPEAAPGPNDTVYLLENFVRRL